MISLFCVYWETLMRIKSSWIRLNCLRCDGKGKFKNEFGLMEKCESCQRKDMTFEEADEQDSDERYD
jgi:hypothetical protein